MEACGYVHSRWGDGLTANLINFLCDKYCVLSNHHAYKKCSFRPQSELSGEKIVTAHTKQTRDVSVMCKRMKHSGAGEGGIRVTHLGVERPPGKSQVGAGHRYCLGQHFLSM